MTGLTKPYWDTLKAEDAENLCTLMLANKDRFQRFFPQTMGQNLTVKASRNYIEKKEKEAALRKEYTFAIRVASLEKVLGLIILKEINWATKQGELAYCMDRNYSGRGWATFVVDAISEYALESYGIETLQIVVHRSNIASVHVAKKCGYLWKETMIKAYTPLGEAPLDMELYELKKNEVK